MAALGHGEGLVRDLEGRLGDVPVHLGGTIHGAGSDGEARCLTVQVDGVGPRAVAVGEVVRRPTSAPAPPREERHIRDDAAGHRGDARLGDGLGQGAQVRGMREGIAGADQVERTGDGALLQGLHLSRGAEPVVWPQRLQGVGARDGLHSRGWQHRLGAVVLVEHRRCGRVAHSDSHEAGRQALPRNYGIDRRSQVAQRRRHGTDEQRDEDGHDGGADQPGHGALLRGWSVEAHYSVRCALEIPSPAPPQRRFALRDQTEGAPRSRSQSYGPPGRPGVPVEHYVR